MYSASKKASNELLCDNHLLTDLHPLNC